MPGHVMGSSLLSGDSNYNFVYIPKNSSSTAKKMLKDWASVNLEDSTSHPHKEYITILRDPTSRWISGMAEFFVGQFSVLGNTNNKDNLTSNEIEIAMKSKFFQNLIFNFVIFDAHTIPQTVFLQHIDISKTKFFYWDETVFERISDYLHIPYDKSGENIGENNPLKKIVVDHLRNLLQNPLLQHEIDKHYYCDHQLFDHIKLF
jgi:hypothetical protein